MLSMTNEDFLKAIFGAEYERAYVTGFRSSPHNPAHRGVWKGKPWGKGGERIADDPGNNNYFVVSTFRDDPVSGRPARRADLLDRLYVFLADDVRVKVPANALSAATGGNKPTYVIETSDGNWQVGYVIEGGVEAPLAVLYEARWRALVTSLSVTGVDPGNANVTRYGRLAVGSNTKYDPVFQHKLLKFDHKFYTAEQFARDVLGITPEEEQAFLDSGQSAPATPIAGYRTPEEDPTGWGAALNEKGLLRASLKPGVWDMECPFIDEHTQRADTGCAYIGDGVVKCHHGHCDERTPDVFRDKLLEEYPDLINRVAAGAFARVPIPEDDVTFSQTVAEAAERKASIDGVLQAILDEWVFIQQEETWIDRATQGAISVREFDRTYAGHQKEWSSLVKTGKGPPLTPTNALRRMPGVVVVYERTYAPGEPVITQSRQGRRVFNTYRPPHYAETPVPYLPTHQQAAIDMLVKLVDHLTGDPKLSDALLTWAALTVVRPELKINWHWLFITDEGWGKDTFGLILRELVGSLNFASTNNQGVSSDYNAWASKKLITINELSPASEGGKSAIKMYDKLKEHFTRPPETIPINPKYGRVYEALNTGAYLLFSNHDLPVLIGKSDRRLAVADRRGSTPTPQPWADLHRMVDTPEMMQGLYDWMAERVETMSAAAVLKFTNTCPDSAAKRDLIDASGGHQDEFIDELVSSGKVLWTLPDLKERIERSNDGAVRSLTVKRLVRRLKAAGAWPIKTDDPQNRVRIGGVLTTVYVLYDDPQNPLDRDRNYTPDEVRDLLQAQSARGQSNVAPLHRGVIDDLLDKAEKKERKEPE